MSRRVLYHTVDDRDNPDDVLRDAPFKCKRHPWLGEGYYFWDTFIELAHWWGKKGYFDHYMITKKEVILSNDDVFDLVGNTNHLQIMEECAMVLSHEFGQSNPTVAKVIEYLRRNKELSFHFKAVRAEGRGSILYDDEPTLKKRLFYRQGKSAYLDLRPAIQICYFNKKDIEGTPLEIVFPEEYLEYI